MGRDMLPPTSTQPTTPIRHQAPLDNSYAAWSADRTPERLADVVRDLDPVIGSEILRYSGPKPLLRAHATGMAIKAVRSYDPTKGAALRSWVTTQLQPLSRVSHQLRAVRAPESAIRLAAAADARRKQMLDEDGDEPDDVRLADDMGVSVKALVRARSQVPAVTSEGLYVNDEGVTALPGIGRSELGEAYKTVYESESPQNRELMDALYAPTGRAMQKTEIAKQLGISPAAVSQRSAALAERIIKVHAHGI